MAAARVGFIEIVLSELVELCAVVSKLERMWITFGNAKPIIVI